MTVDVEEHERSLAVWANTFLDGSATDRNEVASADSLGGFATGDRLVPIVRAVLGIDHNGDEHREGEEGAELTAGSSWTSVISLMQTAGLLEAGVEELDMAVEVAYDAENGKKMAVTCLEALLRHTVTEQCLGRETFIRQIMSLDPSSQATLRKIIVGSTAGDSETGSPSRESALDESFTASPAPSSSASTPYRGSRMGGDVSLSNTPVDSNVSSWVSRCSGGSVGSISHVVGTAADHMTPMRKGVGGINMELETDGLASGAQKGRHVVNATATTGAVGVVTKDTADLWAEIARLNLQLDESEAARGSLAAALESQKDGSAMREAELREEMLKARRAADRLLSAGEDDVISVEKALRTRHEEEVSKIRDWASKAEARARELEPLEEEVIRLRDEVDVLRPAEMKLAKVEESLSRCRFRIEELSELPMQLKREEDAHAEVLDRCLALETEIAQIPALRRQLDSYRRGKTDMEVANRELLRELKIAQQEVSRLSEEVQALSDGSGAVRSEHQRLQEELKRRAMEESEATEAGGGIGHGVSELNPVLSEELTRLRRENQQLAAKINYNTVETIQDLEQRADDANRLADSFHEQIVAERERAVTAENSLAAARTRISELETEITTLRNDHAAAIEQLETKARDAASAAAAVQALSQHKAHETLAAAQRKAALALAEEMSAGAARLAAAEQAAADVAQGLREDMAKASDEAEASSAQRRKEHALEKAELEDRLEAAAEAAEREQERAKLAMANAVEELARERGAIGEEMQRAREEWKVEREHAAAEFAEVKKVADAEIVRVRRSAAVELEEAMRSAAALLATAQEEMSKEKEGRLEESRLKAAALAEIGGLEEELALGKKAALEAIEGLKMHSRQVKDEAAFTRQQAQEEHEVAMAQLKTEFDEYRAAHTVDDETFHKDMDQWEHQITTQKALVANLNDQVDALKKNKRRLEREKTYYWGQAEELRIHSAASGVRTDPNRDADHAQLLEQAKELIEENRGLKQRLQDADPAGSGDQIKGMAARRGGSGVAAMRAEHESEVKALIEEKQDMMMKYQATACRMREQEQRCAELSEGTRELQLHLTKLQLVCKRQEKKLAAAAATSRSSTTEKENRVPQETEESKNVRPTSRSARSRKPQKGGVSSTQGGVTVGETAEQSGSTVPVAPVLSPVPGDSGIAQSRAVRGLSNTRSARPERGPAKVGVCDKVEGTKGMGEGEVGREEEEGTPAECVQS